MDVSKLDKNLAIETTVADVPDVVWYDVTEAPFDLYGLWKPEPGKPFCRMDPAVAEQVNPGVKSLNFHTAGGRVRFGTDSKYVVIHAVYPSLDVMPHMAISGQGGFDMYSDEGEASIYRNTFMPSVDAKHGYDSVARFDDRRMRYFTIDFPLYNRVTSLHIGLQKDAVVTGGARYAVEKPVVYYGSSITQGGCASRPGNSYQAIISRRLNCDHINLGFSGNGRGEQAMAEYIADLPCSVFVMDYDHNAPDPEYLAATHERMYRIFRQKQPETPVIFVSRPGVEKDHKFGDTYRRRRVIMDTLHKAVEEGDRNVRFVDGASFFARPAGDVATVDGTHPNDFGFVCMAEQIGPVVAGFLGRTY